MIVRRRHALNLKESEKPVSVTLWIGHPVAQIFGIRIFELG